MSLLSEMLNDLELQTESIRAVRSDRMTRTDELESEENGENEVAGSDPSITKSHMMLTAVFLVGLVLCVWHAPKHVESIYAWMQSLLSVPDNSASINNAKKTSVVAASATDLLPLMHHKAPILPPLLAEHVRGLEPAPSQDTFVMTGVVKAIAENVILKTKVWENEKEQAVAHFAKPLLSMKLKDASDFYTLENVEIETSPGHTRLRLLVTGDVNQAIEKTLDGQHMNILLPKTKLNRALPLVANGRAPIIGLQANSRLGDLVLTLELLQDTVTQSSVLTHPDGTELVLDFTNANVAFDPDLSRPRVVQNNLPALPPIQRSNDMIPAVTPITLPPAPVPAQTLAAAQAVYSSDTGVHRMSVIPHHEQDHGVEGNLVVAIRDLEVGNFEEARRLLQDNVNHYPRHAKSIATLSDLLLREGDKAGATDLLTAGLARLPHHALLLKKTAELMRQNGQVDEALALLQKSTPHVTEDPDYHAMMAALYQQQGKTAEAKGLYEQLVQIRPDEGLWWLGLGMAQESQGQKKLALISYKTASSKQNIDSKLLNFIDGKVKLLSKAS